MGSIASPEHVWWKDGVVYQIYPASYKDSNGDGMGDLPGILSKIDYIKDLGIDIVWICPMYDSPQHDMGYDISDYENVYPPYGTVRDMENIIKACHERGMRLILDLVVNHTSDEHPWFKESRSSKDNPKRDWYIWRPARYTKDGTRMSPNNWRSFFSGRAWQWDELTQEYYLHLFATQQPDLNWENEECRKWIYKSAMEFWLAKGVDGFRVDTANMYSKCYEGTHLPDAPIHDKGAFEQPAHSLHCNGPRMHEFLREMNVVLNRYDTMTVGELPFTPDIKEVLSYISASEKQLNMVFQFDLIDVGFGRAHKYAADQPWKLPRIKKAVEKWQTFLDGTDAWTTVFIENHDNGRAVSRFLNDSPEWRARSAKLLAIMLCALTGTLFVYQGQEIGMINAPRSWPIEDYKDIESSNYYKEMQRRTGNDAKEMQVVMDRLQVHARDHSRLPMQWNSAAYAGFTDCQDGAWMRTNDSFKEGLNVEHQEQDANSPLWFWRKMIQVRKEHRDVFVHGRFQVWDMEDENVFVFGKEWNGKRAIVVLNFTQLQRSFRWPVEGAKKFLVGNVAGAEERADTLEPYEGRVYLVG